MKKSCPDCGRMNPQSAVTCAECGSLFDDMIGVAAEPVDEVDAEVVWDLDPEPSELTPVQAPAPRMAPQPTLPAPPLTPRPGATFICEQCGAPASGERCARCGTRVAPSRIGQAGRPRLKAWDRGARSGGFDSEFPDLPHITLAVLAIVAAVKILVEIPLGASIVTAVPGYGGLSAAAFGARYYNGTLLLVSALAAGAGAYGTYFLRRIGVWMLAASYAIDTFLVGWLLLNLQRQTINLWPGMGPYLFLGLLLAVATATLVRTATRPALM